MWTALPGSVSPLGCAGCSCDERPSQCVVSEVTEEASGLQLQFHWFLSQFLVAVVVLVWSKGPPAVKVSAALCHQDPFPVWGGHSGAGLFTQNPDMSSF